MILRNILNSYGQFGFDVTAPQWAMASSFMRLLDHTHNDAPQSGLLWTSDQLVAEIST